MWGLLREFYRLFYLQFFLFKWSVKKHCAAKVLLAIWEIFSHENNRSYNSYRLSYKFTFILLLSFLTNKKQESDFQQIGGLVTRNISVFSESSSTSNPCQIQSTFIKKKNFLTCYSCSYYSSMIELMVLIFLTSFVLPWSGSVLVIFYFKFEWSRIFYLAHLCNIATNFQMFSNN